MSGSDKGGAPLPDAQLAERDGPLREQAEKLTALQHQLDQAHGRLVEATQKIELLERENVEILNVLESMEQSVVWKLLRHYRRLKGRLLVPGSFRRRLYDRWVMKVKGTAPAPMFRSVGRRTTSRRVEAVPVPADDFWHARLVLLKVPTVVGAGELGTATVTIANAGKCKWQAVSKEPDWRDSVRLSYHWYDEAGNVAQWDGERTSLPRDLGPDDLVTADMRIFAPFDPGTYILEITLVHEGSAWFNQKGGPSLRTTVHVEPSNTQSPELPSCSIVIPVINRAKFTKACLLAIEKSVPAQQLLPSEVIVVDNGSTDETPDLLSSWSRSRANARVVRFRENLGFARACNEGARLARGHHIVFLNNDTLPTPGWLEKMASLEKGDAKIGIVGCKLLFPNGRIQHIGVVFDEKKTPRHIYRGFSADIPPARVCREYQAVTGACLMLEKNLYWAVGGMDETYQNSYEDVDLCLKVRERGYRVVVCPDSVVYHFEGMSEGRRASDFQNLALFKTRWGKTIDCDSKRWNTLDDLPDESIEFEVHGGYEAKQESRLEDLWKSVYSCPFPRGDLQASAGRQSLKA